MNNTHYDKAPILEAIIELNISTIENAEECLAAFKLDIQDSFPNSTKVASIETNIEAKPEQDIQISSSMTAQGLRFSNSDNTRIIQAKANGMSFSHLPQYTNWEVFSSEAKEIWKIYNKNFKPSKINRLGLRYVNRIDIPITPIKIENYLNLYAHIPEILSQVVSGMLIQLQMPQEDLNAMAVIQEAAVEPAIENGFSLILDIDLIASIDLDSSSSKVWELLENLRCRKNKLFEAFITDETRKLIK